MANLTKNEYIVDMYVRYFGKAPSVAEIAKYNKFGKPKLILTEIIGDADDSKAGLTTEEFVNNAFQNLFGRDATTKEMNKYSKVVDKGKDLPINAIVKAAKKSDKGVYEAKKAIAIMLAEKENTTNYNLDKITKDTYADVYNLKTEKLLVDSVAQLETKIDAMPDNVSGTTFELTTSVDTIVGSDKGDLFEGIVGASSTLTVLDSIDGKEGKDTLNILNANTTALALPAGLVVKNVEIVNVKSAADVGGTGAGNSFDVSGFTGLTDLNITQAKDVFLTAAATTDVNVSGTTGAAVNVDGGKDVTVTDATAGNDITIGATTVAKGNITITDTKVGAGTIKVDGGVNVTITATGSIGTADTIEVGRGGAATDLPTGIVTVTSNAASVAGADETLADIKVSGGSSIVVNQVASSTVAATDKTGATVTMGAVEVDAGTTTTSVTVSQTAATTEVVAKDAVAAKATTQDITFQALSSGKKVTLTLDTGDAIVFTAAKDLTAAEVASAFANLSKNAIQGSAASSLGTYTYTGTMNQGWTSGTVTTVDSSNSKVTFSNIETTPGTANGITVATDDTTTMTAGAKTNGTAEVKAVTGVQGVAVDTVTIDDNTTAAVITTITVDGYASSSTIGATTATTKLETLTLKNAAKDVDMVVADTAATLALTLENMGTSTDTDEAVVTFTVAPTTLNITNTGDNYVDLTAAATTTLSVAGSGLLNIADVDLAGLKTLTVSGAVSLVLSGNESNTLTSVITTTTGTVTASIDGTAATYTGGAGVDNVTLVTGTALTKAIDLGAGDDTLTFTADVASSTATLSGGAGTDTLVMTNARAAALDGSAQTLYTNFERLTLSDTWTGGTAETQETNTLNLANLGLASYITTAGTLIDASNRLGESDILVLDKLAANATVVLTADGIIVAQLADASGSTDVINIAMSSDTSTTGGNFTVANVETVNISVNDIFTDTNDNGEDDNNAADTLTLTADKATTVNVTGSADLTLTLTGSTKVTTIDASSMTGNLTVVSVNSTTATTIKGGAGNDTITGAADNDVLIGGAGNDKLTAVGELTTLTGGAGNDTFVMNTADTVNGYATITDLSSGDIIDTDAATFTSKKVTLADTAVFQDYANAAVNAVAADGAIWFQYQSNTYLVVDSVASDSASFTNGSDQIIKIAGLVDLSTAVFNATTGDLTIA